MAEPKILVDFPNCPKCGSSDRVSVMATLATADKTGVNPGDMGFSSLGKVGHFLIPPEKAIGVTVPMLVIYEDICGGCGLKRCVRAEIIDAPITMAAPKQGPGGGFPPQAGPGGGHFAR